VTVARPHRRPNLVSAWFESYYYGSQYRTKRRRTVSVVICQQVAFYPLVCPLVRAHHPLLLRYSRLQLRLHRWPPIAPSFSSDYRQIRLLHPPPRYAVLHPACSNQCHMRDTWPNSVGVTQNSVCVYECRMVFVPDGWGG